MWTVSFTGYGVTLVTGFVSTLSLVDPGVPDGRSFTRTSVSLVDPKKTQVGW